METYEKQEIKTIQKSRNTEAVEIDGNIFIRQINPGVIIMPYTLDEEGNPSQIGIINEILDQRATGISKTLITGTPDDSDVNIFQTAIRELLEESGFEVKDIKRWNFLGSLYTSKLVLNASPCFSVNLTSLVASEDNVEKKESEEDENDSEKDSKFELINVDEALSIEDSLISTLFIKTFKNLFIKSQEENGKSE